MTTVVLANISITHKITILEGIWGHLGLLF